MENLKELIDASITLKTIPVMIPVLFYFLGTQTSSDSIKTTFQDRKTFSYAILFQIVALPFLGLLLSQIFSSNIFSLSIAVVLLAPGGFISGILTHFKKGNIPLSVTLTSITSIVSPLTTVAWLSLISVNLDEFEFNFVQTFTQLVVLIFLPYSIGFFVNYRELSYVNKSTNFIDKFIKLYILIITFTGPFELRDPLVNYFSESILLVVCSIISIYLIQKLSSKLVKISKDDDRTILIEALCQNFPIVLTLSIILNIPEMAIFGIIYYLITLLVVVPFSLIRN
tara:strand:+ start:596 stop:1444 length:849 start_codon:yes stop_codon:yes gene_type:complete